MVMVNLKLEAVIHEIILSPCLIPPGIHGGGHNRNRNTGYNKPDDTGKGKRIRKSHGFFIIDNILRVVRVVIGGIAVYRLSVLKRIQIAGKTAQVVGKAVIKLPGGQVGDQLITEYFQRVVRKGVDSISGCGESPFPCVHADQKQDTAAVLVCAVAIFIKKVIRIGLDIFAIVGICRDNDDIHLVGLR